MQLFSVRFVNRYILMLLYRLNNNLDFAADLIDFVFKAFFLYLQAKQNAFGVLAILLLQLQKTFPPDRFQYAPSVRFRHSIHG